jgi:hypothetical protein
MHTDARMNPRQRRLLASLSQTAREPDFIAKPWGSLQRGHGHCVVTIYPPRSPGWAARVARLRMLRVSFGRGSMAFDLPTLCVTSGALVGVIATGQALAGAALAGVLLAGWALLVGRATRELAQSRVAEVWPDRVAAWAQTFGISGWPLPATVPLVGHAAALIDLALQFEHAVEPVDIEATRWRMYDLVPLPAHLPTRDGEMWRFEERA